MNLLEQASIALSRAIRRNATQYRQSLLPCTSWPDGSVPVPDELQALVNRLELIEAAHGVRHTQPSWSLLNEQTELSLLTGVIRRTTGCTVHEANISATCWQFVTVDHRGTVQAEGWGTTRLEAVRALSKAVNNPVKA